MAHNALHTHERQLTSIFEHPVEKFLAATVGLSTLIYLIVWSLPHVKRPTWKGALTIGVWSILIVIGHGVTHIGESNAEVLFSELREMMGVVGFILLSCAYALFLAMPFVAAIEIGLLIMAIFGVKGVFVAYFGTIIGLNLAFSVGRLVPPSLLNKGLQKLDLSYGDDDFDSLLERLVSGKGWLSRLGGTLLRNRYITLALCLNFPGNSIVGGGGGLSILSGMSRRLGYWPYFLMVTILATLPIPLFILFGFLNTEGTVEHSGWFHELLDVIGRF